MKPLHRIFQHDPALFARAIARTLDIKVTEPRRMSELNVDLTETHPIERPRDRRGGYFRLYVMV